MLLAPTVSFMPNGGQEMRRAMETNTRNAEHAMHKTRSNPLRVLIAASIGQFVEFYDFAIYGLSVVIIAASFFPGGDPTLGILSAFAVYGIAFIARPLGGVFFGAMGDRLGRKAVLYVTLLTIGISTALIGLLPTYHQIGILAPILLVLLRLVQGFSAGGEAIGAPSFVLEHAPKNKRASWITIAIAMSAVPTVLSGVFIYGLSSSMSDASFESWGWRIPFLIAAPLSVIGIYIRRRTEESPAFKELTEQNINSSVTKPLVSTFKTQKVRMVQVLFIMALSALGFYFLVGYFVTYLQTVAQLSREESLLANAVGVFAFAVMLPVGGRISDKIGRRRVLLFGSAGVVLVTLPAFLLVTSGDMVSAMIGQVLLAIPLCLYGGGSYTFFVEIFPTATRLTAAAISYNISFAFFGGAAPYIGAWLVNATSNSVMPGIYLALIAVVSFVTALLSPETSKRELGGDK